MLYVKVDKNGVPCEYPIAEKELRYRLPNVFLPKELTPEVLASIGFVQVPEQPAPERVSLHATVPDIPVIGDNGEIVRTYEFVPYTEEGLEHRRNELRAKRDKLLKECDWTQSEDVQAGMTAVERQQWSDYRAALRNMTDDFEDPNIVTWPVKPAALKLPKIDTRSVAEAVKRRLAAKRIDVQGMGMTYTFPDGTTGTVQTRNAIDVINITGQAVGAMALSMQGDTTTLLPFRDAENVTHELTPLQMVQMAMAALNFVSATYLKKWELENKLDELTANEASGEELVSVVESWTP